MIDGRTGAIFPVTVGRDGMRLRAIEGIPEIVEGDDIGGMLDELDQPAATEVVVIASTIVSKAEGRGRCLDEYEASRRARAIADRLNRRDGGERDPRFAQAVLAESEELIIEDPFLLSATHFGHIGVNAGIDRTNLPEDADILLMPANPMDSAQRIHNQLQHSPPVIISDTSGRPFRRGQRGVAIGWAGIPATRDWRGYRDRRGKVLQVTVEAVVDELASAANLVTGESDEGRPVVYVEDWYQGPFEGDDELFRPIETDFVRQALREWEFDQPSAGD